jgi:hypothetical protein
MPGLDPGIHTEMPLAPSKRDILMDCRVKPGNDENGMSPRSSHISFGKLSANSSVSQLVHQLGRHA